MGMDSLSNKLAVPGHGTSTYQASLSSPCPSPSLQLSLKALSPVPPASISWRLLHSPLSQSQTQSRIPKANLTAVKQRFLALKVLNHTFPSSLLQSQEKQQTTPSGLPPQPLHSTLTGQCLESEFAQPLSCDRVIFSEQTTGITASESHNLRQLLKYEYLPASHLPAPSHLRLLRLPSHASLLRCQTSLKVRSPPTVHNTQCIHHVWLMYI